MADFTASFEGGSNGATITTGAGEAAATKWGAITGTPAYSNAQAAHGALSAVMDANGEFVEWNTLSASDHYGRMYIYMTQAVTGTRYWASFRRTGQAFATFIGADENGRYYIADAASSAQFVFSGNGVVLLNQWVRIEYHIVNSATVGQVEAKFFAGDSTSAFVTLTSPATWNTDTVTNSIQFGSSFFFGTLYMDSIVANATSYPGPFVEATPLTAGFETGVDGNAVATADAGDDTAWDVRGVTGSGILVYDDAQSHSGNLAAKYTFPGSSVATNVQWTTALGTLTEHYGRIYLYATAYGNSTSGNCPVDIKSSGTTTAASVFVNHTTGFVGVSNAVFSSTSGTVPIALNQWVRIEWHAVHATSGGLIQARLFNDPESDTPTETITFSNTNTGASATAIWFGSENTSNSTWSFWLDDIVAGASSWVGPFSTFGQTISTGGADEAPGANYKVVSKFTLDEDASVTRLSLYGHASGGASDVVPFIYADSAGSPGALEAVGTVITLADVGTPTWHDSVVSVELSAGDYWLGFNSANGFARYYRHTVTNNRKYKAETYSATSPADPFGTVDATDNLEITIYATYAVAEEEEVIPGYQRLYGPAQLATSAADLYTVPDGAIVRLRKIYANNPTGAPVDFTFSIGADAAATRLYDSYNVPAGGSVETTSEFTLAAGEKIQAYAGTGSALVVQIDAYVEGS